MSRHQAECPDCKALAAKGEAGWSEDCPTLRSLQDQDALAQMRAPGPVRPSPSLVDATPFKPETPEQFNARIAEKRARLTPPTSAERPRAGKESA